MISIKYIILIIFILYTVRDSVEEVATSSDPSVEEGATGSSFESFDVDHYENCDNHYDNLESNNYEEFSLKYADNIAACFYIVCATVTILIGFVLFLPKIVNITIV